MRLCKSGGLTPHCCPRQKERRLEEEKLRKVKTLGEAADDVDDVSAWINKSRALEEKAKAEARAKALKAAQALEEQVRCSHSACVLAVDSMHQGEADCLAAVLESVRKGSCFEVACALQKHVRPTA